MLRTRTTAVLLALSLVWAWALPASANDPEDQVGANGGQPSDASATASDQARANAEQAGWVVEGTHATLAHVARAVAADKSHDDGFTGQGIGVALIDTGVAPVDGLTDVWHGPDLSLDSQAEEVHHHDVYGHGTHLAGIITSDRADAPGIAPDATLLSLKVGAYNGAVDVSQVIAAIDWVVQHADEHNIRVLVLAYGTDSTQDPLVDPLSHAVETAWRSGITVVVGAGNDGETRPELVNPATNPYVIAVGAVDTQGTKRTSDDTIPAFSAPGTSRTPDLWAPGVGIVSAQVPGGYLDTQYPDARQDDGLFRGNGTSQAAAVVGGAAALLLSEHPDLTPDQVKARLIDGADKSDDHVPTLSVKRARESLATGVQTHAPSTGTGSLDAARGTARLSADDQVLSGEQDIHGVAFDSTTWAAEALAGTTWDEGTWNDTQWTGWGWNGWGWNGSTWNGSSWNGWGWNGWGWNGSSWNGWGWNGWGWNGWGWNGWGWNGWGWNGVQWD